MADDLRLILAEPDRKKRFSKVWGWIEKRSGPNLSSWNGSQRVFLMCCWAVNELNNGGLLQWYMNAGYFRRRAMLRSLDVVGAMRVAAFMRHGSRLIRQKVPIHLRLLGAAGYESAIERVPDEIDDPFYDEKMEEEVETCLLKYVETNLERF